jgi:hypothetical protein
MRRKSLCSGLAEGVGLSCGRACGASSLASRRTGPAAARTTPPAARLEAIQRASAKRAWVRTRWVGRPRRFLTRTDFESGGVGFEPTRTEVRRFSSWQSHVAPDCVRLGCVAAQRLSAIARIRLLCPFAPVSGWALANRWQAPNVRNDSTEERRRVAGRWTTRPQSMASSSEPANRPGSLSS